MQAGNNAKASSRLSHLHALMDEEDVQGSAQDGIVAIPLPPPGSAASLPGPAPPITPTDVFSPTEPAPPPPPPKSDVPVLHIQTTPPQLLTLIAYLLSAVGKRDPEGRKPKRGVFARAGVAECERVLKPALPKASKRKRSDAQPGAGEAVKDALKEKEDAMSSAYAYAYPGPTFASAFLPSVPVYSSQSSLRALEEAAKRIRIELLSELASEQICRSELREAGRTLGEMEGWMGEGMVWTSGVEGVGDVGEGGGEVKEESKEVGEDVFGPIAAASANSQEPPTSSSLSSLPPSHPPSQPLPSLSLAAIQPQVITHGPLWTSYAPLLSLQHAHLAHALGDPSRAVRCYLLASRLSPPGSFIDVAAKAGDVLLRIGLLRSLENSSASAGDAAELDLGGRGLEGVEEELREDALEVAEECKGMGMCGETECLGEVLRACVCGRGEILRSK